MFVVCEEHLERAIEEFVDELLQAPDIYLLSDVKFKDWTPPVTCQFCSQNPKYLVL